MSRSKLLIAGVRKSIKFLGKEGNWSKVAHKPVTLATLKRKSEKSAAQNSVSLMRLSTKKRDYLK